MSRNEPQDEQVKIARSSAVATWVGVLIAATGLLVSIVAVYINRPKKPQTPSPGIAQQSQSAPQVTPQVEPKVQRSGGVTSGLSSPPTRNSKIATSKRAGYTGAAVRRRSKRVRERER